MTEQEMTELLMNSKCIKVTSVQPGDATGWDCTYALTERGRQLRDILNGLRSEKPMMMIKVDEHAPIQETPHGIVLQLEIKPAADKEQAL